MVLPVSLVVLTSCAPADMKAGTAFSLLAANAASDPCCAAVPSAGTSSDRFRLEPGSCAQHSTLVTGYRLAVSKSSGLVVRVRGLVVTGKLREHCRWQTPTMQEGHPTNDLTQCKRQGCMSLPGMQCLRRLSARLTFSSGREACAVFILRQGSSPESQGPSCVLGAACWMAGAWLLSQPPPGPDQAGPQTPS